VADAAWVVEAERIVWQDGVFLAENGHFDANGAEVRFARAEFSAEGVRLDGAAGSVCDCAGPDLWSIEAKQAELDLAHNLRVRGAWLRVADRRALPLPPMSVPLERRRGLLLPQLETGYDGLRIGVPVYLTLGESADLTLTPEVRTGRAVRLLAEHRYAVSGGGGETRGMVAWDWARSAWRGSVDAAHAVPIGYGGWAASGTLVSDAAVYADYGDRYLDRRRPWGEARTLLRYGALELGGRGLQAFAPVEQEWGFVRVQRPAVEAAGFVGSASASVGWVGSDLRGGRPRAEAEAELSRPVGLGPLRFLPHAAAAVRAEPGLPLADRAIAEALLAAPAWRRVDGGFERFEPRAGLRWTPETGPTAVAGVLGRRTGPVQTLEGMFEASWGGDGFGLTGRAWLDRGPVQGFTSVAARADTTGLELDHAIGAVALVAGPIRPSLRYTYAAVAADTEVGRVQPAVVVDLPGRAWTVGAGLAVDPVAGGDGPWLLERGATLGYRHPSGCLDLDTHFRWDADRAWPDVGLRVGVSRRR
jgi:hypothetical protein